MLSNKSDKRYVVMLLLTSLFLYLIWAIVIPFNAAPDEFQRFDIVDFIFKYRELPITGDNRLIYGDYGITYASTPYFPYLLSGIICIISSYMGITIKSYLVARLVSVIAGVVTVYFCWLISNKIFKDKKIRYFFPIFMMFIPQFAFVCGYVNQDSFTVMLTAIIIYLWLIGIEGNWSYKTVICIGVTSGVVLLSYLNGYSIIVATLIVVLISYKDKLSKEFLYKLLICLGIMFLVSGWFFIRNVLVNDGDFLGLARSKVVAEELAIPSLKPSNRITLSKQGLGYTNLIIDTTWVQSTFKSFWGAFGYMDKFMDPKYYMLILSICILAFGGAFSKAKEVLEKGISNIKRYPFYIGLFFSISISILLHMYYSVFNDYQAQGRYLFPALVAIIIVICRGLDEVIPHKWKAIVYKLITVIVIIMNIIAVGKVLYMSYYIG